MAWYEFFKSNPKIVADFGEDAKKEPLEKTVKPVNIAEELDGQIERNKVVFGLESGKYNVDNIHQKTRGRLLDKELRDLAQYDAIVSIIVRTRSTQCMPFGYPSKNKYDRGFILKEINPILLQKNISQEEKENEATYRLKLSNAVAKWVGHCGITNKATLDYVFHNTDTAFKDCTFSDFLGAQARNLLIYGRCATQIIRNKQGIPMMFRPMPVETLFRVMDNRTISLTENDQDVSPEGQIESVEYKKLPKNKRPIAYVQRIQGKNVSFFTEDDIRMTYLEKQAYEGLEGYPLAPLELSYYSVLMHFNSQVYLQNAFAKGLGSKGLINIKTADGAGVSKQDLENFRKMFTNYVARNDNSATIPVISGPLEVQFIPLNATAKDLEFINLYNRILQILCASFQISPHEIGFGALDSGDKATVSDEGRQDQIVQGEERGLRNLLDKLFLTIDNIVSETFPEVKDIFRFEAIGLGQNTKEADLNLYKEELQTTGTFSKLWADSERGDSFPFGGEVPTSPVFHQSVAKYMKFAELRHYFFKEEGALDNPAYDFLCDPALDQIYQSLKVNEKQTAAAGQQEQLKQAQIQTQQMQQPQPQEQPPQQEAGPSPEEQQLEAEKLKAEMRQKEEEHKQKLKHKSDEHALNLRLAYQKAKAAQLPTNTLSGIIAGTKG